MDSSRYSIQSCPPEAAREGQEIRIPLTEEQALMNAGLCLSLRSCESCDLCRMFCPDLCITRDPVSGRIEIDDRYCKGCGICAFICPKGAIRMERES